MPTAPPAAPPRRSLLPLLAAMAALAPLSMHLFAPVLPVVRDVFAMPQALVQLSISLPLLAMAPATLVYGPAADRYGRRPVLIAALVVFLCGAAVAGTAMNLWLLMAGRMLQAVGGIGALVLSRTIVSDRSAPSELASRLATITMVMVVAPLVAPLAGGLLAEHVSWRALFAVLGAFGVGLLTAVVLRLPETRPQAPPGPRVRRGGLAELAVHRAFMAYALQNAMVTAAFLTFVAGAPTVFADALGRGPADFGGYFAAVAGAYLVGNFIASRVSTRVGSHRMVSGASAVALIAAIAALALALAGVQTAWSLVGPMVAIVLCAGLSNPNAQAGAISAFPQAAGAASGGLTFLQNLAGAVATQLVGMFSTTTMVPLAALLVVWSVLSLASLALLRNRVA